MVSAGRSQLADTRCLQADGTVSIAGTRGLTAQPIFRHSQRQWDRKDM